MNRGFLLQFEMCSTTSPLALGVGRLLRLAQRSLELTRQLKVVDQDNRVGVCLADKADPIERLPLRANDWQVVKGLWGLSVNRHGHPPV